MSKDLKSLIGDICKDDGVKSFDWKYNVRSFPEIELLYESQEDRSSMLSGISLSIQEAALKAMGKGSGTITVINVAPGVGNSYAIAQLVHKYNIAWFAERHNTKQSIAALKDVPEIKPPAKENCNHVDLHNLLVSLGYSPAGIHKGCEYGKQFSVTGSVLFMHQHLNTGYPLQEKRDLWVIDEFNLSTFFPDIKLDIDAIDVAARKIKDIEAMQLTDAVHNVVNEIIVRIDTLNADKVYIGDKIQYFRGKVFFDVLDNELAKKDTSVSMLVRSLYNRFITIEDKPTTPANTVNHETLPSNKLVTLVRALHDELWVWLNCKEKDFNSYISVGKKGLSVTQPMVLEDTTNTPPIIILDATCDIEIAKKVFPSFNTKEGKIEVDAPPDLVHVWLNTSRHGTEYSKHCLVHSNNVDVINGQRLVNKISFLFERHNIDTSNIGVISFKDNTQWLAMSLDVDKEKTLYYGNMRGSNALENYDTLLVVGNPIPNLEEIRRLTQCLYYTSKAVITDSNDTRFQHVLKYMANSELTQACHRNRPIRYHDRTVITVSAYKPEYLPVTMEVTSFPYLDRDTGKTKEDRFTSAYDLLVSEGEKPTRRAIQRQSGLDTNYVAVALKAKKAK